MVTFIKRLEYVSQDKAKYSLTLCGGGELGDAQKTVMQLKSQLDNADNQQHGIIQKAIGTAVLNAATEISPLPLGRVYQQFISST